THPDDAAQIAIAGDHLCPFRLPREEICHAREERHAGIGQRAETARFVRHHYDGRQRGFEWLAVVFTFSHCFSPCSLSGCWSWILVVKELSIIDDRSARKEYDDLIRLSPTHAIDPDDVGASC